MRRSAPLALATLVALSPTPLVAQSILRQTAPPKLAFAEPGIAPNGSEIAFVHGGDIWVVPARGGEARLLVAHAANESRPIYSPDGAQLAFMSNRAGSPDIWILTLGDGSLRRLTFDDGSEQLDGWSRDGRWIYFSSAAHDIAGMSDVYRVKSDGGTPMPVAADRYAAEFMAAPAPNGDAVAIVARGFGLSQWWRKGHSHLDESELWVVRGDGSAAPRYEQITKRGAKQQWPMWGDAGALYYVSDGNGTQNLWTKPAQGDARALTTFTNGRVMWPTMTTNGSTIAFERDFGVWTYDVASRKATEVPITVRGVAVGGGTEHLALTTGFSDLAVSPDGKKLAFIARGEVFASPTADAGDATRITTTPAAEGQVTWSPDSRKLAYVANRDGAWNVFVYDFATNKETPFTAGRTHSVSPRFSPDGKQIAFLRDARELCVASLETKQVRVLAQGIFGRPPFFLDRPIAWSPDSRWVAYLSGGAKLFMNAYVVPAAGGDAHQVSWLANTRATSISWSGDGTFLLLDTGMRTEPGNLARVDLLPFSPKFREDQFTALFRDETPGRTTPPAPAPARPATDSTKPDSLGAARAGSRAVRIVFDGIRTRLSMVPVGVDVGVQALSADGKQVIVTSNVAGQTNLFAYAFDEFATDPAVTRQITTTAGNKSSVQFAPDGKSVWFLEQGRIVNVTLDNRNVRQLAVRAEVDVDFAREKWDVFHQTWEFLNDNFYDPEFHGADWSAVHSAYAPWIAGSKTTDEMRRVLSLMIGEMNASHMGITGPPSPALPTAATGRLGLEFDRGAYEKSGQLRVTAVILNASAALTEGIRVGDYLLAIDGERVAPNVSLDSVLAFKVGKRMVARVSADANGANARDVALRPRSAAFEKQMLYRAWIEERRALVAKLSGGRLGYVHMLDMGNNALTQLNVDLDAEVHEKDAVVFDVRNNNGGFMNGHALDVLSRKPYVDMVRRGVPSVPGRPVLGQRSLEKPTILITSQATLSDGENFTEGYRAMKLGTVVGEPTAMWDVYTGGGTMVDGTSVRLPFMRNAQLDAAALERASRKVDIPVDRPMGESYTGRDVQLERAVQELMLQIRSKGSRAESRQ
ncbi:MAG TPA: S41 family peptidase [Gemmatimonadaceae bacterium]|nr:S41 family peptidase [Gemmatimonadaceae bacterium]